MTFDPGLPALVVLQALHGLTYGAAHLGAIQFMAAAVPQSAAGTAQALYATMAAGCVIGAVTLASGPLYATYMGGAYWVAAGTAAMGLAAILVVARRWDGGLLWVSPTAPETAAK
jgi:PPP family 3-phenylpropionic acid transporter